MVRPAKSYTEGRRTALIHSEWNGQRVHLYKQIGERVEAVKAQRLLQEDEDAPSHGDRRATRRCSYDWALTGESTWK